MDRPTAQTNKISTMDKESNAPLSSQALSPLWKSSEHQNSSSSSSPRLVAPRPIKPFQDSSLLDYSSSSNMKYRNHDDHQEPHQQPLLFSSGLALPRNPIEEAERHSKQFISMPNSNEDLINLGDPFTSSQTIKPRDHQTSLPKSNPAHQILHHQATSSRAISDRHQQRMPPYPDTQCPAEQASKSSFVMHDPQALHYRPFANKRPAPQHPFGSASHGATPGHRNTQMLQGIARTSAPMLQRYGPPLMMRPQQVLSPSNILTNQDLIARNKKFIADQRSSQRSGRNGRVSFPRQSSGNILHQAKELHSSKEQKKAVGPLTKIVNKPASIVQPRLPEKPSSKAVAIPKLADQPKPRIESKYDSREIGHFQHTMEEIAAKIRACKNPQPESFKQSVTASGQSKPNLFATSFLQGRNTTSSNQRIKQKNQSSSLKSIKVKAEHILPKRASQDKALNQENSKRLARNSVFNTTLGDSSRKSSSVKGKENVPTVNSTLQSNQSSASTSSANECPANQDYRPTFEEVFGSLDDAETKIKHSVVPALRTIGKDRPPTLEELMLQRNATIKKNSMESEAALLQHRPKDLDYSTGQSILSSSTNRGEVQESPVQPVMPSTTAHSQEVSSALSSAGMEHEMPETSQSRSTSKSDAKENGYESSVVSSHQPSADETKSLHSSGPKRVSQPISEINKAHQIPTSSNICDICGGTFLSELEVLGHKVRDSCGGAYNLSSTSAVSKNSNTSNSATELTRSSERQSRITTTIERDNKTRSERISTFASASAATSNMATASSLNPAAAPEQRRQKNRGRRRRRGGHLNNQLQPPGPGPATGAQTQPSNSNSNSNSNTIASRAPRPAYTSAIPSNNNSNPAPSAAATTTRPAAITNTVAETAQEPNRRKKTRRGRGRGRGRGQVQEQGQELAAFPAQNGGLVVRADIGPALNSGNGSVGVEIGGVVTATAAGRLTRR